ncbi:MAG: hypothetical protein H0X47_19930 [Nitrospirales bacterium]|nr:hypothetical protein [Nitrospirales bacterium]
MDCGPITTSTPKGFRDTSFSKPFLPGVNVIAKQEWNGIRIDGEEAKAKTVFGIVQFKRLESAIGLKKSVGEAWAA